MSDGLTVPRGERHVLRVFALDMDKAEVARLRNRPDTTDLLSHDPSLRHADPAQVAALFGIARIDPAQVEIVDTADLSELGLAAYLTDGDAAAEPQIAADRARLDALRGHVLTVTSAAFPDRPVTLIPAAHVSFVGAYSEEATPVRFEPLPSEGARGSLHPRDAAPASPAARGRGVAVAVAALALFVILVVLKFYAG